MTSILSLKKELVEHNLYFKLDDRVVSVPYAMDTCDYIWGLIRDDKYCDGKIRLVITSNLTRNPYVSFTLNLLLFNSTDDMLHNIAIESISSTADSIIEIADKSFISNNRNIIIKYDDFELYLPKKYFRKIKTRVGIHEQLSKELVKKYL
jgi:hypothetical protein